MKLWAMRGLYMPSRILAWLWKRWKGTILNTRFSGRPRKNRFLLTMKCAGVYACHLGIGMGAICDLMHGPVCSALQCSGRTIWERGSHREAVTHTMRQNCRRQLQIQISPQPRHFKTCHQAQFQAEITRFPLHQFLSKSEQNSDFSDRKSTTVQ